MQLLKNNANPLAFLGGLGLMTYGLWSVSPQVACITLGAVLMGAVLLDAGVKIAFRLKERR